MIQIDTSWLTDKNLHDNVRDNPKKALQDLGYSEELLEGKEFVVVANTKDIFYVVLDGLGADAVADLANIQAAGNIGASTALCIATLSSASSICGTAITISTGSSAGTVGCVE